MVSAPTRSWDALATKDDLRVLAAELRAEMADLRAELHKELKAQTWRLTGAVFVAFGLFATLVRFA